MTVEEILKRLESANIQDVAKATGIPPARIYKWRKGEGKPKTDDYNTLKDYFSYETSKKSEVIPLGKHLPSRAAHDDWEGLPMYNVPITASFVASYRDEHYIEPQYYFRDPRFKDCDFGAIITGDSMHSEIRHGDFVVCKEVTDQSFIVFGEIYYVVAKNGLETCKYLNAGDDQETVLLVPRNERISPSPIKKSMIQKLYKVRGIVRGY